MRNQAGNRCPTRMIGADDLNENAFSIAGTIQSIDIIDYENNRIEPIAAVTLGKSSTIKGQR